MPWWPEMKVNATETDIKLQFKVDSFHIMSERNLNIQMPPLKDFLLLFFVSNSFLVKTSEVISIEYYSCMMAMNS